MTDRDLENVIIDCVITWGLGRARLVKCYDTYFRMGNYCLRCYYGYD